MVKIAHFGHFDDLPPLATALLEGDLAALDAALASGTDLEAAIALDEHVHPPPLVLALAANVTASVHWLVEHGAQLNRPDAPAFPLAARHTNPDTMRYLVQHGADLHARLRVGGDAYQQALYGEQLAHLPVIEALGHRAADHGGEAFRSAVFNRNRRAVEFFLAHGVDLDFHGDDQVLPDGATPLLVAARLRDTATCRQLLAHGANPTLADRNGERPYTAAIEHGDAELAALLRASEPPEWHSVPHRLRALEPLRLTPDLLAFLQGSERRIELPGCDFGFIDCFALTDTIEMQAGGRTLLRLSRESGDYTDTLLVWNPDTQRIGYWDVEHQQHADIAGFADFLRDAPALMNRVLDGEFDDGEFDD